MELFLLGVLAAMFFIAGTFFIRFWLETRDSFFLAFAAFFIIDGLSRVASVFQSHPNEGSPWIYVIRLLASLLILWAILKKNYGKNG